MTSLLGIKEELKVFKCPNCNEYISSKYDTCPKCSYQFTDEVKQSAIEKEEKEVKAANRKFYKTMMYTGFGVFALGGLLLLSSIVSILFTEEGRFFIWSPVITLLGLGQIIYGLKGMYKER